MKCPVCGKGLLTEAAGDYETVYKGRDGSIRDLRVPDLKWQECGLCGEAILDETAVAVVERARREAQGLLSAAEIRGIRMSLAMTQAEISRILGIGEKTYCRWERGAYVQSVAFDRYLRLLAAEPRNVALLKQMEMGTSPAQAGAASSISETVDDSVFTHLVSREALIGAAERFTEILASGELHYAEPLVAGV